MLQERATPGKKTAYKVYWPGSEFVIPVSEQSRFIDNKFSIITLSYPFIIILNISEFHEAWLLQLVSLFL